MPMYFTNPVGKAGSETAQIRLQAMLSGDLGFIATPRQGNRIPEGVTWCADNGCFSEAFNENQWWAWLVANAGRSSDCAFAVAPDVVGDAAATLKRSRPWLARIRELGYPVAFVAQDGWDDIAVPWDDFDVLFIGGGDDFKLGEAGARAIRAARERGYDVHMGRVNSRKRWQYAADLGCTSVDGTYAVFHPTKNLPKLLEWHTQIRRAA